MKTKSKNSLVAQIPVDRLREMVSNSFSFKELERKIGYQCISGGRQNDIVRAVLDDNEIDYSHFYVVGSKKKRTFEDSFCEHSTASMNYIKRYIKNHQLLEYKCAICGLPPEWNGQPLVLTLDHINGDHTDNRLENLRYVCPNCDRQLPTFARKNNAYKEKPKRYCRDCGTELQSETSSFCPNCARKHRQKVERPSREILKAKIRKQSFLSIGKEYGVSDNAIRKWCKQYQLPFKVKDIKYYTNEEWLLV